MQSALSAVPPGLFVVPATRDEHLPGKARGLVAGMMTAAGVASLVIALRPGHVEWAGVASLAILAMLAERLDINLYGGAVSRSARCSC
jgi:hypothetical protein